MDPRTPGANKYEVKRIYESLNNPNRTSKNSGRDINLSTFGIPYKYYENNLVVIEEQQSRPKSTSKPNTPLNGPRPRGLPLYVAPNLGKDSPGPAAKYNLNSSIRDKDIRFGRKDYP